MKKIEKGFDLFAVRTPERKMLSNWVLGSRKMKTREGAGRVLVALVASGDGQGARGARGAPAGVLEGVNQGLEGARRRGTGSGGEGEQRRWCSGMGTAARSGVLASRDQGEAS